MRNILNFIYNILERIIALFISIILTPFFAFVYIIVGLNFKSNPIFKQQRMGKNGRKFNIYKFRTLKPNTPNNLPTNAISDYRDYSTKLGLLLRNLSIDELPQLLNIIKGDMSFVGPRPVMINEVELNIKRLNNGVYNVKPGITGWAQINGRDDLEIDRKVFLDTIYVKNKSLLFDLYIILKTAFKVVKREGVKGVTVVSPTNATLVIDFEEEFNTLTSDIDKKISSAFNSSSVKTNNSYNNSNNCSKINKKINNSK